MVLVAVLSPLDQGVGVEVATKDLKIGGQNVTRRSWKIFNQERCLKKFQEEDWSEVFAESNVDVASSLVEEFFCKIIDSEAPMITVQTRTKYMNWLTDNTKAEMILRDIARDIAKLSDTNEDWSHYRQKRNLCTSLQKKDRASYLSNLYTRMETTNDSKTLYATTKKLIGSISTGPPTSLQVDGKFLRSQKDVANAQSDFYQKKVETIKQSLPGVCHDPLKYLRRAYSRWEPPGGMPKFVLRDTNDAEVLEMLLVLKRSHAFGRDLIDAATVKIAAPVLAPVFRHIINLSLGSSVFPQKWKMARILPLQKSMDSDRLNPGSFRPVAQLPLSSKLAERVVQKQLLKYLEESGQLAANQHAYRDKCTTTSALIQIMDYIATATDANLTTTSMGIDQSAAFDCVDHRVLTDKLSLYGLDERTTSWINSYLKNRSEYVAIGSAQSRIRSTTFGVPQGSVLGPLLYLIYVNEFPSIIEDDMCVNPGHRDTDTLFGKECRDCGSLTVFAMIPCISSRVTIES